MKTMKRILVLVLALILVFALTACGLDQADLVGYWYGSWEYEGAFFNKDLAFAEDGTYVEIIYKNRALHKTEEGTYEISGSKVECHPNGEVGITTPYKYKNGELHNGDNVFVKG